MEDKEEKVAKEGQTKTDEGRQKTIGLNEVEIKADRREKEAKEDAQKTLTKTAEDKVASEEIVYKQNKAEKDAKAEEESDSQGDEEETTLQCLERKVDALLEVMMK